MGYIRPFGLSINLYKRKTTSMKPLNITMTKSALSHLECSKTGERYSVNTLKNVSSYGFPLLVRYDFSKISISRANLSNGSPSLWRYEQLLPILNQSNIVSLGEGWTPLLPVSRLRSHLNLNNLFVKDESVNPTGSFKARGMSVAVSKSLELGAKHLAVGTAGNAGSALAAYAAESGLHAHIAMPDDTPKAFTSEIQAYGADLTLVHGLITDANAYVGRGIRENDWFDMATLKEPYRIEGKKTMGYELYEQLDGELPDVILYPTGGGTGLIGMWKAFDELEELGLINSRRPRMVSVQSDGCAPIVRAYNNGEIHAAPWENASTIASGLRVPKAIGDFLIIDAIRKSNGTAISVTDQEIYAAWGEFSRLTGIFAAPEGAATLAALKRLLDNKEIGRSEKIVLFNTGSGLKYTDTWANFKSDY